MSNTIKILIAVVVLVAVGAGAWLFLFDEEPPKPAAKKASTVAVKSGGDGAKAPAGAPKAGEPAKAAEAPKAAEPAKAGEAPKAADAPKSAEATKAGDASKAAAAKPAAGKPIPSNPDQLIAEVIAGSGLVAHFATLGAEFANYAAGGGKSSTLGADGTRAVQDAARRTLDVEAMSKELAAKLKADLDAERMSRYLEVLRQPAAAKVSSDAVRRVPPQELAAFAEGVRKEAPAAARAKLIQSMDDATQSSALGSAAIGEMTRTMVDAMLADIAKAGKKASPEAGKAVVSKFNAMRNEARGEILSSMQYMYGQLSDDDLSGYVKLLDTDSGRWGRDKLIETMRPLLVARYAALGKEIAPVALANRGAPAAAAKAAPAPKEAAPAKEAEPEPVAAKPAPKPAEPAGYQRASNIRELYTRYNDVVSATVTGDRAAVKELLDDGKHPNVRQKDGLTALMIAAANNDSEIASMLLAKGADPNLRAPGGRSALSIAKEHGAKGAGMVQLLQRAGAKD